VSPILALALVAAAGIAATHLQLPALRHRLSLYRLPAIGGWAPFVLLGLLLGPGLGVLDRPTVRDLAPVTALGVGWIGAAFGARLDWRLVRRVPRRIWALAALQGAVVFGATALGAWLLARAFPTLAAAWRPTRPALLILAAAATVSAPGAVALVARATGVRRALVKVFERAATLDTAIGALAFALTLAVYHPRQPFASLPLAALEWGAVAVAASGGVGMVFLWLSRLRPVSLGGAAGLDLLGVMLFGAGVGYAADLSPFVVCALAAALIVNLSGERRRVRTLLEAWEPTIYAAFLMVAGALLDLPTLWVLPTVVVLGLVRVAGRWVRDRVFPPSVGLPTVAQGSIAVSLGGTFYLFYGGPGEGGAVVLTTVLLGVALAQALAAPLMALAVRSVPLEVRS
jgi:hypothetical protein